MGGILEKCCVSVEQKGKRENCGDGQKGVVSVSAGDVEGSGESGEWASRKCGYGCSGSAAVSIIFPSLNSFLKLVSACFEKNAFCIIRIFLFWQPLPPLLPGNTSRAPS